MFLLCQPDLLTICTQALDERLHQVSVVATLAPARQLPVGNDHDASRFVLQHDRVIKEHQLFVTQPSIHHIAGFSLQREYLSVYSSVALQSARHKKERGHDACRQRHPAGRPGAEGHNYAADFLMPGNQEIPQARKERYYQKLENLDPFFNCFSSPNDSQEFHECCESAVAFLREKTRDNHLVLEENINYGFCKNLHGIKTMAIILCSLCDLFIVLYSIIRYRTIASIPLENYFAFAINSLLLIFWIVGVTENALEHAGKKYAITLLGSIDGLPEIENSK